MQQTIEKVGLDHVYFIFADNRFENHFSNQKMKALLNFHALMYGKLVIPDTFFVNNSKLIKFFNESDHLDYLESGIIVPSIRNNRSLTDIYQLLDSNGTIIQKDYSKEEVMEFLSRVNLNHSIKWDLDLVANNFSINFFNNLKSIGISVGEKNRLKELLIRKNFDLNKLTRVQLLDIKDQFFDPNLDSNIITDFEKYIDITYNFNLPNLLQFSATYPDLLQQQVISPESVFLNPNSIKAQQEVIRKEHEIESNIFNEGILASLNFEQINYLRSQREFKDFQYFIRKNEAYSDSDLNHKMISLINMFDRELKIVISPELQKKIEKEKRMLSLKTGAIDFANDESTSAIQEIIDVSLSVVGDFLGVKALGRLFNLCMRPIAKKHEVNIELLDYEAKKYIKQTKNERSILDTVKEFSISNVKI